MNPISTTKRLAIKLKAEEDNFITGISDLNEPLDQTEKLYEEVKKDKEKSSLTANDLLPDSELMRIHTRIAKNSARFYKPDSLVFNATEFSMKLKFYYDQTSITQDTANLSLSQLSERQSDTEMLWLHLGAEAKKLLYTVPSFSYIHGTFDPDPVEVVKKKRKMRQKDTVGRATRPVSTNITENSDNQDMMIKEAERLLGILGRVLRQNNVDAVCFYEFTVDPESYGRTVENIFTLSLLVKEGCVKIIEDKKGLPCLSLASSKEKERKPGTNQCIISIGVQEWKNIVQTLKLEKALIPPRKTVKL